MPDEKIALAMTGEDSIDKIQQIEAKESRSRDNFEAIFQCLGSFSSTNLLSARG
jgi:hypothetical protein